MATNDVNYPVMTRLNPAPPVSTPPKPGGSYRLGGLGIHSDLALPELTQRPPATIDIRITKARLPDRLLTPDWQQTGLQIQGDSALLTVPSIARYLIKAGRTIQVDPATGANPADVRLFLLGTAFGILCHQRGLFPLHASAIVVDRYAIAFVGASGAGKSTLGAWLARCGYPLLTDDVCLLQLRPDSAPLAHSGSPRIKLWQDALDALYIDAHGLPRDLTRSDKFHLTLQQPELGDAVPLRAIYLIDADHADQAAIEGPLDTFNAVATIADHTYRQELIAALGHAGPHFNACGAIARRVPVYHLHRPRSLRAMDGVVDRLQQHWTQSPEHHHARQH